MNGHTNDWIYSDGWKNPGNVLKVPSCASHVQSERFLRGVRAGQGVPSSSLFLALLSRAPTRTTTTSSTSTRTTSRRLAASCDFTERFPSTTSAQLRPPSPRAFTPRRFLASSACSACRRPLSEPGLPAQTAFRVRAPLPEPQPSSVPVRVVRGDRRALARCRSARRVWRRGGGAGGRAGLPSAPPHRALRDRAQGG